MTLQPLTLHTDASTQGLGAILYQGDGKDRCVLTFSSHMLLPAETRYTVTELEALAIIWGIDHNCHYFLGIPSRS